MRKNEIDKWIKFHENKLEELRKEKSENLGNKQIRCAKCSKRSKISKIVWYESYFVSEDCPYSGRHYSTSDANSGFICPKCETRNRLLPESVLKLKGYFKEIQKVYPGENHRFNFVEWVNAR